MGSIWSLGLGLGLGLSLVALGDVGIGLADWDDLAGVGVILGEAEVHVDEGAFACHPRNHLGTEADLEGVNNFCGAKGVELVTCEERTDVSSGNGCIGCLSDGWLGLLGSSSSEAFRFTRFAYNRPAKIGGGLVGGLVIEGGDRGG